jgi:hypothetical protein
MRIQQPVQIPPRDRLGPSPGEGGLAGLAVRVSDRAVKLNRFTTGNFYQNREGRKEKRGGRDREREGGRV